MPSTMPQQFDVFAQLVATGSITGCARSLGLPPSAVLESMNALEDRMGFQLFAVRDGKVELTQAGRSVVDTLGQMTLEPEGGLAEHSRTETLPQPQTGIEQIGIEEHSEPDYDEALLPRVKALVTPRHFEPQDTQRPSRPDLPTQTIVLASHPAIFTHFQEALIAFEQASPDIGITLRLETIDETEVSRLFDEGLADIAYYYTLGEGQQFASRYAWSERISLFASKDHPLARKDSVVANDLASLRYVALASGNSTRTLAERALANAGLAVGVPEVETDNLYQIMQYVESNSAYFAAFGPMARDFGRMSGIRRLAYAQGLPQIEVRQAVRPDRSDDAAILALSEFLFR